MDRELKIIERYDASADAGAPVPNTAEYLRRLLTHLYVMGGGDGLYRWEEDDREFFQTCLLEAAEGRDFVPFPLPWPPNRGHERGEIADLSPEVANELAMSLVHIHQVLMAHGKAGIAKKIYDATFMIDHNVAVDQLERPHVV